MRFLLVNQDYPDFLQQLYATHPELADSPFEEQMHVRADSLAGTADFYSWNLRALGHQALDVFCNNEHAQRQWAKEHGLEVPPSPAASRPFRGLRRVRRWAAGTPLGALKTAYHRRYPRAPTLPPWLAEVLAAQIRHYRPDVLLMQAMTVVPGQLLATVKEHVGLLVGYSASPFFGSEDFAPYDLFTSSLPNYVTRFQQLGIPSELFRLGFETRVLESLTEAARDVEVSFVGSLSEDHRDRVRFLEAICQQVPLTVWGGGAECLGRKSPLRACHRGQVWGLDYYRVLKRSRMTLNHHISIAEEYANNMRLYEATGVGTLLLTDAKRNLGELFEVGAEVVSYRSAEEAAIQIEYYLSHEDESRAVAEAGQRRTLTEHTYADRARELVEIVGRYL